MKKEGPPSVEPVESFDQQKRQYFIRIGLQLRQTLKLHKQEGLWDRNAQGERDWVNASKHCIVEAARSKVLANKFGLSLEMGEKLIAAAALHDFYKRKEIEAMRRPDKSVWGSSQEAAQQSDVIMKAAGFDDETIRLAESVGHLSLKETEEILVKENLAEGDIAFLMLHYIDDYTHNHDWTSEAVVDEQTGVSADDMDRRILRSEQSGKYEGLNQEGVGKFGPGETMFQAQYRIGVAVEKKLVELLGQKLGVQLDPKDLPAMIDGWVKEEIAKESLNN